MLNQEQETNLRHNAKKMVEAKKAIESNLNQLIKDAQKVGYSVNPKTGEVKPLIIV